MKQLLGGQIGLRNNSSLYLRMLLICCLGFMTNSCKRDEFDVIPTASSDVDRPFIIENIKGHALDSLDTGLLQIIKEDLIKANRISCVKRLEKSYNFDTGELTEFARKDVTILNSSKTSSYFSDLQISAASHIENYGWSVNGWILGGYHQYDYTTGSIIVGWPESTFRLEAFAMMSNKTHSELWAANDTFLYSSCGWKSNVTTCDPWVPQWIISGTTGQARPLKKVGVKMGSLVAYNVYIRPYGRYTDWGPWVGNGQYAAVTAANDYLEAFELAYLRIPLP